MRISRFLRLAVAALASAGPAMSAGSATATAQGLFDLLLGGGQSYPQQHQGNRPGQTFTTPGGKPYQFPSSAPSRRDDGDSLSNYGKYRTLCVRTCDGYYFPISTSTNRKGFARDEARCQAACGGDARLFHTPANQSTIDDAVDSDGRSYVAMRNAFLYRKKRVDSCQCRQAPWSEAEMSRHRAYADAEAAEKVRQPQQDKTKIAALTAIPDAKSPTPPEGASPSKPTAAETAAESSAGSVADATANPASALTAKPAPATRRAEKTANRAVGTKPPQGSGPVPVILSTNTKPPAPAFTPPMALGGGGMHWPGDPLPQATARKR